MASHENPSRPSLGSLIAAILMVCCPFASFLMALLVDGNGGFLGLKEVPSLVIWSANASVGVASAIYVLFAYRPWRKRAAAAIFINLILVLLFLPAL
jgi:hypothetical protein